MYNKTSDSIERSIQGYEQRMKSFDIEDDKVIVHMHNRDVKLPISKFVGQEINDRTVAELMFREGR